MRMGALRQIALTGHGHTREECLDEIRSLATRYFGVDDDADLKITDEQANVWTSTFGVGPNDVMFELAVQVTLVQP